MTDQPSFMTRGPDEGETNDAFGFPRRFILTAADTGGVFSIWSEQVPAGSGPPLHVHKSAHELFQVQSGRLLFACGEERVEIEAGGFVFVPAGTPHTFKGLGPDVAEAIISLTPGGGEAFFQAVSRAGLTAPADMAEIAKIASKHDLAFVGPPLE